MITRTVEICKNCGQLDPWRQYAQLPNYRLQPGEVRRIYVKCRRCSKTETISYRLPTLKIT